MPRSWSRASLVAFGRGESRPTSEREATARMTTAPRGPTPVARWMPATPVGRWQGAPRREAGAPRPNGTYVMQTNEHPRQTAQKTERKVARAQVNEVGLKDKQVFVSWENLTHRMAAHTLPVPLPCGERHFVVNGSVHATPRWAAFPGARRKPGV